MKSGRTLDLGCGQWPRNPYSYSEVCGLDLYRPENLPPHVDFRVANISVQPLPFGDNDMDAISAFDVVEHIPRVLATAGGSTRYPFIDLMNEVWRVLKPNGVFYAFTPAFPNPEAFQDPTHVNIITEKTHEYFCGERPFGRNYGFTGHFEACRVKWMHKKNAETAEPCIRKTLRNIARAIRFDGRKTHLLWELRAVKQL